MEGSLGVGMAFDLKYIHLYRLRRILESLLYWCDTSGIIEADRDLHQTSGKPFTLPKIFIMCQTRDELILSYKEFFHLTEPGFLDAILREGLLRQPTNTLDPGSQPLICVSPAGQIGRWRDQLPDATALVRIAAADIVTKGYGIDVTFRGWEIAAAMGEIEGLQQMIEVNATLAVYDRIPPDELTVIPEV